MEHLGNADCYEIFNQLDKLKYTLQNMKSCVQNPDFVNKEYAEENLKQFEFSYNQMLNVLFCIRCDVIKVHKDLLNT